MSWEHEKDDWQEFLAIVSRENFLQGKYLRKYEGTLTLEEKADIQSLLGFYRHQGASAEQIAEAYLFFIDMVMQETMYFYENDDYRYHTFEEVAQEVYFDESYMTRYMMGLALSDYLLNVHRGGMQWFSDLIGKDYGERYLEIGPGHGAFFCKAMKTSQCKSFLGVDISAASVAMTKKYLQYRLGKVPENCQIVEKDFFTFGSEEKFNVIVMGEVLEHVEKPLIFLEKIRDLAAPGALIFLTVPINMPVRDHIYLFRTKEQLFALVEEAGLKIKEYRLFTHNSHTVEKAEARKEPIMAAMVLQEAAN